MNNEFAIGRKVFYEDKTYEIKTMPRYIYGYNYWSIGLSNGHDMLFADMAHVCLVPESEEVTKLKFKNEHYEKLLEKILPIVDGTVVREHLTIDLGTLAKEIKETLSKK